MGDRNTGRFSIPDSTMYPVQRGVPAMYFNIPDDAVPSSQPAPMERSGSGETCATNETGDSGYFSTYPTGNDGSSYAMQDVGCYDNYYQYDGVDTGASQTYAQDQMQPQGQYVTGTESQHPSQYAGYEVSSGSTGQQQQYGVAGAATALGYTTGLDMNRQAAWTPLTEDDIAEANISYNTPLYDQSGQGQYEGQYEGQHDAQPSPALPAVGPCSGYADADPTSTITGQQDYDHSSPSSTVTTTTSAETASAVGTAREVGKFPCLSPECERSFGRTADLDRHLKVVHFRSANKRFWCDYRRCGRSEDDQSFSRRDHCRDHYRSVHKEDVPRRGQPEGRQWWAERALHAVYEGWWRCSRCLARVEVADDGYVCRRCGSQCEGERQAVRGLPVRCDYDECEALAGFYRHDRLRNHLGRCHGEDLPRPAQMEQTGGARELGSEEWWRSRRFFVEWWRCNRCLARVDAGLSGWECPVCSNPCEVERVRVRGGLLTD